MILQDIKQYVKERQQVTLKDVALHFDKEPETIEAMLAFWVKKGRIQIKPQQVKCGGSCSCSATEGQDVYLWNPRLGNISIEVNQE